MPDAFESMRRRAASSLSAGQLIKIDSIAVSVRDFGAIGDGASHPLSAFYASLGEAQAVHPTATDLAEELDGVATQTAIYYLRDNGGGTLFSPRGKYICNTEILLPSCVIGQPAIIDQHVNWHGESWSTEYKWNVDLGSGKWAVRPQEGTLGSTGYKCDGFIRDMIFTGPAETYAVGVAPCVMHGVHGGAQRKLYNVGIRFFYAGLCIAGDHSMYYNVIAHRCYYGMYFENPYTNLFGGYLFEGVYTGGSTFASIGADYRATVQGTFIKCYMGASPYAIYRGTNGATVGSGAVPFISSSIFTECSFEWTGNALISDESEAAGGIPTTYCYDFAFEQPLFTWNDDYKIAGNPRNAVMNLWKAERLVIDGWKETFGWDPGALAIFNFGQTPGVFLRGNVDGIFNRARLASKHVFAPNASTTTNRVQFHQIGPSWDGWGRARQCATGSVWVEGDILSETSSQVMIAAASVGLHSNQFAGIALEGNDGTAGNICMVCDSGMNVMVNANVETLLTNTFVKLSDTAGKAAGAINIGDGCVIGYQHSKTNGSGSNGFYNIHIINPPYINRNPALPIRTETGTAATMSALNSREGIVTFSNAGAVTYTIPANATTPIPLGVVITLYSSGAAGVTVSPAATVTLNGTATIAQFGVKRLVQVATDVWVIF